VPAEKKANQTAEEQPGRYVCIAGFAETSRDYANHLDTSFEIWSLNRCYVFLKNWDRWYEVHEEDLYTGKTGLREDGYLDMLRKTDKPVYMQHPHPDVPTAIKFDLGVFDKVGFRHYYRTSIAHMLAHACYEHKIEGKTITELHICGVDMSAYSEYSEQLPCVNYWLGVVEGLGIKVVIPTASPLLKGPDYGVHDERLLWAQAKERLQEHKKKQSQLNANLNAVSGALDENTTVSKLFNQCVGSQTSDDGTEVKIFDPDKFQKMVTDRKKESIQMQTHLSAELNCALGQMRETQHWIVALNAPQTEDEEPEAARLAN